MFLSTAFAGERLMTRNALPFVVLLALPTACADSGTSGLRSQYQIVRCDDAGLQCEVDDFAERGLSSIGSFNTSSAGGASPTPAPRSLGGVGQLGGISPEAQAQQDDQPPPAPRSLGGVGTLAGSSEDQPDDEEPGQTPAPSRSLEDVGGLSSFATPSPAPAPRSLGDLGTFGSPASGSGGGGSLACDLRASGQGVCVLAPGGSSQGCAEQGGTIASSCPGNYFGTCTQEIAGFSFVSYAYPEGSLAGLDTQQAFAIACESTLNGRWEPSVRRSTTE
jgi:hypothetical protein